MIGEIWLSVAIGVILMLIGRNFAAFSFAKLTGREFHTQVTWTAGPRAGQEVDYPELQGFTALSDSAIFLFGLAMVLEGISFAVVASGFRAKVPVVIAALIVAILATGYNLFVVIKLFGAGTVPIVSLLAVAFGVYTVINQWKILNYLRTGTGAPMT